jgi:hypothetical protein
VRAFQKLVPHVAREIVLEVWNKERYPVKEEFMGEMQGVGSGNMENASEN